MTSLRREFMRALKESPRMYFAPLIGAYQAVKREFRLKEYGNEVAPGKDYEPSQQEVTVNEETGTVTVVRPTAPSAAASPPRQDTEKEKKDKPSPV